MLRYLLVLIIAGLFTASQAEAQMTAPAQAAAPASTASAYTIAPGDRLDISVLEDPTLNRQVLVRPDGKISMPLAGTIDVSGHTPEEVQSIVRARLSKHFVAPPNVTVALSGVGAEAALGEQGLPAFYVMGEVNKPGRYAFDVEKPVSVLQALSIAGGLGVFAARSRIQVRHSAEGAGSMQLFDYDAIESGDAASAPIMIQDGDVIVVPERGLFN
jgi:polysaccharide export outer membrane protein